MSSPLSSELRARLGAAVQEARRTAESGARQALQSLAVDRGEPFDTMSLTDKAFRNRLLSRGRQAGDKASRDRGTQEIGRLAHEVAYEHWHRMLFARFLAENNLLIAPRYGVAVSLEECRELAREEGASPWQLAGEWAEEMLPEIFGQDDPVLEVALLPETRQKLETLLESLPESVFTAQDSLGWTYQYWRADEKDQVNSSGKKIGADELPAVTQLFTERYIVLFLLHNTIGAWRAGKVLGEDPELAVAAVSEDALRERMRLEASGGYDFTYLRFTRGKAPEDPDGERPGPWCPAAGSFPDWPRAVRDLRVLDPCCGSGHFLVEAFDLLVRLRMEDEALSVPDAIRAVLTDNLFGLEIDPRCTQIAAFNVALAAWRMAGGWIRLPPLNIACSGIAPEASEAEWVALADRLEGFTGLAEDPDLFGSKASLARGPLQEGMARLHRLFGQARELGSLIDPGAVGDDLLGAEYESLREPLDAAIRREGGAAGRDERAVAAAGMARAAEILTGRYTLVVTNVPFLARGKQSGRLRKFAEEHHGHAKGDIATVFVSRIFRWLGEHGTQAVVTPQNWLFLTTYRKLRERLLNERTWNVVARLGSGAFETISGEVVNVALTILSADRPGPEWEMAGVDVSAPRGQRPIKAAEKAELLSGEAKVVRSVQAEQLRNPDSRVLLEPLEDHPLLSLIADYGKGSTTGDRPRFLLRYWELPRILPKSVKWLDSPGDDKASPWTGRSLLAKVPLSDPSLLAMPGCRIHGHGIWERDGVAVRKTGELTPYAYGGEVFDDNVGVLAPRDESHASAVLCFCESGMHETALRQIDQKLNVTAATLVKVPFDLEHWTKVAAERYPNGLPEPYSDDPTQWIFHGDPCRSVIWDEDAKLTSHGPTRFDSTVLQVAVARLLGYRWPPEQDPEMRLTFEQRAIADRCGAYDRFADRDGIVCLSAARGEPSAADRLRALLAHAYGGEWSSATERRLLAASAPSGRPPQSLEDWLRDRFFEEHCQFFHHRPFIWHIWDGRNDGFHALVNYHRLAGPDGTARRTLESLAYAYLNDWIERQRAEQRDDTPGADDRLAHALDLQAQLKRILEGEPPCDVFVRWKPLHAQAIGWDPDLNDGVRLNIRPFMRADLRKGGRAGAGILRWKPNIKWDKDRGKEPGEPRPREHFPWFWGCPGSGSVTDRTDYNAPAEAAFDGNRWNDLHYTGASKVAARQKEHRGLPQ